MSVWLVQGDLRSPALSFNTLCLIGRMGLDAHVCWRSVVAGQPCARFLG